MSDPRLLILDEPSLGLMPTAVDQLFEITLTIHSTGISLILVEENVHRALDAKMRRTLASVIGFGPRSSVDRGLSFEL